MLTEGQKCFRVFSRAQIRVFCYFWCQIGSFQIDEMASGCPENRIFLKIDFIQFFGTQGTPQDDATLRNSFRALQMCFLRILFWLFGSFWRKKQLFCVFSMIFDDFWWFCKVSIIWQRVEGVHGCTRIEKSRNTKNELKHPQTIIECHTKGFKVRLGGLGCHMS